ncbi:MAG: prepilin-type N-terminal cleavage/methylation domain-containing protein [Halanaerobiales bacterium]
MKKLTDIIKYDNGITLVEILLAIAIIGIVISMSTGMIARAFRIIIPNTERMSVKKMAENNLQEIIPYVRNAKDIDADNNIVTTTKSYKVQQSENKIIIKDENDNIIRNINNILEFEIKNSSDLYTIIIKKCVNNKCNDTISLETEIYPRN